MQHSHSPAAQAESEKRAKQLLAEGRFRKARDEFKLLCKIDRPRYLPFLIQANQGLVREMLDKGMVSEAEQVVAYLRTIATPAELQGLELVIAAKSGRFNSAAQGALACLASLPPAESIAVADSLVLSFQQYPGAAGAGAEAGAHLAAIHQALEALATQDWSRVNELLRPLPRGSPFSHWKLFLKGLVAFHADAQDKAVEYFGVLPAESVPARAALPYLLVLRDRQGQTVDNATTEALGHMAQIPHLTQYLVQSDKLWREQNVVGSYQTWRPVRPAFPSEELNFYGVLSEFYFNSVFALPEAAAEDLYNHYLDLAQRSTATATERKLAFRVVSLYEQRDHSPDLQEDWEEFLKLQQQLHGPNPRLESAAYAWLGSIFASSAPRSPFAYSARPQLFDAQAAQELLAKSIALDPGNLSAHLALCQVYEFEKMTSDRNRLLDNMTIRFPDNKAVLVQAGRGCLDRQAFRKGLEYLERALELDRVDPRTPELLVLGRLKLAQQYYEKGRLDYARETVAPVPDLALAKPDDLLRGSWCVDLRLGLFELFWGSPERARPWLDRAHQNAPMAAAFLLYADLAHRSLTGNSASPFRAELETALQSPMSPDQVAMLLRIHHFWRQQPEFLSIGREESLLRGCVASLLNQSPTPDQVRRIAEIPDSEGLFAGEIRRLVDAVLKQDPQHPFFRLLKCSTAAVADEVESERDELQSIVEEAQRRGDEQTVQMAREALAALAPQREHEPTPFDEWEPDEEFPEEEPLPTFTPPDAGALPPEIAEEVAIKGPILAEILSFLAGKSDRELRELRRTRPKGIPAEVFDMLVDMARQGLPEALAPPACAPETPIPPAAPPTPARRPSVPKTPRRDPNQLDLF